MPPVPADVEVSIVTLGDTERLRDCIASLPAACKGISWRVTVVDNSPDGGDLTAALAPVPSTKVIRSKGRRGFGANQNLVLRQLVRESRARYALILNDDTELDAEAVTTLVSHADRSPQAGLVGARIRDARGREEPSVLPWPSFWEQAARAVFPRLRWPMTGSSGWLNGACMLARVSTLREVGFFDPSFFLFFEDADLCLRAARRGWELEVCSEASLVHHGHQTIMRPAISAEAEKQLLRSRYLYFRKHRGRLFARMVTEVVRCGLVVRTGRSLIEDVLRGRRPQTTRTTGLWSLARTSPAQPTLFERDADHRTSP